MGKLTDWLPVLSDNCRDSRHSRIVTRHSEDSNVSQEFGVAVACRAFALASRRPCCRAEPVELGARGCHRARVRAQSAGAQSRGRPRHDAGRPRLAATADRRRGARDRVPKPVPGGPAFEQRRQQCRRPVLRRHPPRPESGRHRSALQRFRGRERGPGPDRHPPARRHGHTRQRHGDRDPSQLERDDVQQRRRGVDARGGSDPAPSRACQPGRPGGRSDARDGLGENVRGRDEPDRARGGAGACWSTPPTATTPTPTTGRSPTA